VFFIRKPFDVFVEGFTMKESGDNRTAVELFVESAFEIPLNVWSMIAQMPL